MIRAPSITSLAIAKLSANYVHLTWDDVGSNFYYVVEVAETHDSLGGVIAPENYVWQQLGYTAKNEWFDSEVRPDTYYVFRIQTVGEGFARAKWVTTEEFQTFKTNAYTIEKMRQFNVSNVFVENKLTNNDMDYINFNRDILHAALMKENYVFSPFIGDISSVRDSIVREGNYHEIQENISVVCNDPDRNMIAEIDGIIYLFERWQPVVKVSNDKGLTWKYYKALNGRVGNPVARNCVYQSKDATYVLGYDRTFIGRRSNDIRWSSIDRDAAFSSTTVSFVQSMVDSSIGFEVEQFGDFAWFSKKPFIHAAEAFCVTNSHMFVAAQDTVIWTKLSETKTGDPGTAFEGKKIFESNEMKITDNPRAVTKKMDVVNGRVFALITGQTKMINGKPSDPAVPSNVERCPEIGVYMMDDADPATSPKWVRVFGNKEEERRLIQHEYTGMSTNGYSIFINYVNYIFDETVKDQATLDKYPSLSDAVRYYSVPGYSSHKKLHMGEYRAHQDDFTKWEMVPHEYYNEANFNWMARSGTRVWITHDDRILVVYPEIEYSYAIDTEGEENPARVVHEVWDKGKGTFYVPNIEFKGFNSYAGGVMLYKESGEIFGYFEFDYRVRDSAEIFWKPKNVALVVDLKHQIHEEKWKPEEKTGLQDPDLRPHLTRIIPESYLLEESNFEAFSKYYLQFISDGNTTYYNKLLNLIRNKYPREENSFEWLWSEINKRNIYLDKSKREEVVRFFEARSSDFYSTKGIEKSYKFLFKLLYNEEVEIEMESKSGTEYDILVESTNFDQDIVGRTIQTATGRSNVTYLDREFSSSGHLVWRVTIHNMIGRFQVGQRIEDEFGMGYQGTIVQGIQGKSLMSDDIEYINRERSYYVMKIKSVLPASRWMNDVVRFVHPVGFGFIGVTLLTMFINSGLTMKHVETIINNLKTYRWDSGLPTVYPDRVAVLQNGEYTALNEYNERVYALHPKAGQPFPIDVNQYNTENKNTLLYGKLPADRRFALSPTFDQSAVTFAAYRDLVNSLIWNLNTPKRYKDEVGHPRDPGNLNPPQSPTQVKYNE
ncbi:baseplate wedge subunit [Serratia phage PS2]|uniref:Baseplate wedge subunit n=1 Tax=Serratia phage PS2 TaxID=1481112 RepID=A0A023W6F5_9CAUD|nr:baseplate wedge subunit [Serratia phage PS2]AHY25411.1 baseplate wedge subunit [Serratia phage PS2]